MDYIIFYIYDVVFPISRLVYENRESGVRFEVLRAVIMRSTTSGI
jgi:hypothetical protein